MAAHILYQDTSIYNGICQKQQGYQLIT